MYAYDNPLQFIDPLGLYWQYSQSSGQLTYVDNTTGVPTPVAQGYSGQGEGLNNPYAANIPNVGPPPLGTYDIGPQRNSPRTGPGVLDLAPRPDTHTFGRSDFQFHGDNRQRNFSASEGCIILPRAVRDRIENSNDSELRVVW